MLYNSVDGFIDEVNAHHGGSSALSSKPSLYPTTMMLVEEEAKDEYTNVRSEEATWLAQESLKFLDTVLADAVRWYKAECGRDNPTLTSQTSAQEHVLVMLCCLLCEQTGYGSELWVIRSLRRRKIL
jgi:carbamoylphosphate synthase large subunit